MYLGTNCKVFIIKVSIKILDHFAVGEMTYDTWVTWFMQLKEVSCGGLVFITRRYCLDKLLKLVGEFLSKYFTFFGFQLNHSLKFDN